MRGDADQSGPDDTIMNSDTEPSTSELEQRLDRLEAENEELREKLETVTSEFGLNRRQVLGGLLGGGALLGLGGTQRAAAEASPWEDSDGDGLLETGHGGIDVGTVQSTPEQIDAQLSQVSKRLISEQDQTIYVDPSGDDSNDGSSSNPVATIQEAVNRIPLFLLHDFYIQIANGTYDANKDYPAVHLGPVVQKGEAKLKIVGNENNPGFVECANGINWTAFGKLQKLELSGIHWGNLSQFAGQAYVTNCEFRGNDSAAISGKSGNVLFDRCDIGDGNNDTYAVWGIMLERMYFKRTSFNATDTAIKANNGCMYHLGYDTSINAPNKFDQHPGSICADGTQLYVGGRKI